MLILLDALPPAERVAFVLHDMFDVPFDDVAAIVGKTPEAARQLASRARRRVRGASAGRDVVTQRHDELVRAFLASVARGKLLGAARAARSGSDAARGCGGRGDGRRGVLAKRRACRPVSKARMPSRGMFSGRARAAQPRLHRRRAGGGVDA